MNKMHTAAMITGTALILVSSACIGEISTESDENVLSAQQAVGETTPIDWADTWVNGWTGSARGPNAYGHASEGTQYTLWVGDSGANGQYSNFSDCSFFGAITLKRAYNWTDSGLASWLCDGSCPVGRPQAKHFHDSVEAQDHFTQISDINSVAKGDLIAMKYFDGSSNTGHVLWADGAPQVHCSNCTPKEYKILVVDSSASYHGTADTRYIGGTCTTDADCSATPYAICSGSNKCSYSGIGRGTLRLLVDASNNVIGYSWSTASNSTKYLNTDSPLLRHIVIGRYDGSAGQ